ncbi:MAG: 30S ribosomal protein S3 [Patescibacteria group bacterium]
MGQKVNPQSLRLKINEIWRSSWFSGRYYSRDLISDLQIRRFLAGRLKSAAVAKININRDTNKVVVDIFSGRPGLIIGRKGTGTEELRRLLAKFADSKVQINIIEIKSPDTNSAIIAQNVAHQIERRIPYKRAIKQAIERAKEGGVQGIKIQVAGRLNGAEIARREKAVYGTIPLSTFKSSIDYSYVTALTTYGIIGVKVWVYRGEKGMEEALAEKK